MPTREDMINQLKDDITRQAQEIHLLRKRLAQAVHGVVPEPEYYESNSLWCNSGVTPQGKPFITMRQGPAIFQLSVEAAIAHSLNVLQCAEAAVSDAYLHQFMRKTIGANAAGAAGVLSDFRAFREKMAPAPPILDGPPAPTKIPKGK